MRILNVLVLVVPSCLMSAWAIPMKADAPPIEFFRVDQVSPASGINVSSKNILAIKGTYEYVDDASEGPRQVVWHRFFHSPLFIKCLRPNEEFSFPPKVSRQNIQLLGAVFDDGKSWGPQGASLQRLLVREGRATLDLLRNYRRGFGNLKPISVEGLLQSPYEDFRIKGAGLIPTENARYLLEDEKEIFESLQRLLAPNQSLRIDFLHLLDAVIFNLESFVGHFK